ncbi:MAG: hypothetical protein A2V84_05830 [Chloroflexi bacterium RBG_16_70_13]|nr:MAG: hypothetical protein A2V84_05830 [Chloroflexi bacterium RBG_16_70_13]
MPALRVRVLGGFSVELDGRPLPDDVWRRNRARSLVKLLAIAPRARLHREQLMDALWPELDPAAASANLRKALHFARAALGSDSLTAHDQTIALDGEPLEVDAATFEAAARAGRVAEALELYRGDLLPDDRFEAWAEDYRERLRGRFHRVLRERAEALEREGDVAGAVEILERHTASDPLNEEAHLSLIRILAQTGERHLALRRYRALETILRDELGVEPDGASQQLYADLVKGTLVPATAGMAIPGASQPPAPQPRLRPTEELKLVTVVWADAAVEREDPEAARREMDEWSVRALDALDAAGATARTLPAGAVLGVFGVPSVREDDVPRALRAALELAVARPPTRVGVASGHVLVPMAPGPSAEAVSGSPVVEAGQLRERAGRGTALVAARTVRAAGLRFRFDPPEATGEGVAESPQRLRAEVGSGVGRPDSPLVGRGAELAAIEQTLADALSGGVPRAVLILGPAGVGKSRIVREVLARLAETTVPPRVLVGRCQAGGRAGPYRPLADVLRQACGVSLAGSAAASQRRLRRSMSELLGDAPDDERETTLNALGVSAGIRLPGNPLDSLAPGGVAASLAMAWPRFASALAARIPTVVVLEDLHWASSELLDMIEHIVRRAVGPLVVLATARPEVLVARPDIGANEHLTMIGLGPLGEAESRRLVAQLLGPGKLDIPTRDGLLARAEGNPFYLEQLALHVRSSRGGLLPDTLQSLLASRMDTLSIADRRVLQEAAVIGRIFWVEPLVRALDDDRVAARLAALERSGFVVRRPSSSLPGQVEHAFRHALLHDVAYASMPRARRARAHAAAGAWLEAIVGERVEEHADLLAHHAWAAVSAPANLAWPDPGEREAVRAAAFEHLLRAGRAARRQFATERATELHGRAHSLAADDRERLQSLEELAEDAEADFRGDAAEGHLRAALELVRRSDARSPDIARLARKLAWLMANTPGAFRVSPDPQVAEALIEEGLALAQGQLDQGWLLVSRGMVRRLYRGSEPFGQGAQLDERPMDERIEATAKGGAIGSLLANRELIRASRQTLGVLYGIAGRYRDMVELAAQDAEDIRPSDSRLERSDALRKLSTVRIAIEGAFEAGLEIGQQAKAIGGDAPPHQVMHALSPILVSLFHLGRWDELLEALDEHMAAFRADPATECQAVRDGPAIGATALAVLGRAEEARTLAAVLGDPLTDQSASAWQARYATASGHPDVARAITADRAHEGRTYGPQHAFAYLEALSEEGDLGAATAFLPEARRFAAGNALLGPLVDRVAGEIRLVAEDRRGAVAAFRAAVNGFAALSAKLEEARSLGCLATAVSGPEAASVRSAAEVAYARLGVVRPATTVSGVPTRRRPGGRRRPG